MKVLLIGAGAVGTYFCGRLQQGGAEVAVVARGDYDAVCRDGYEISSVDGDFRFVPDGVYRSAAEYPERADWIIAATKVLPSVDLPELMRPAVTASAASILLIQNGIGIEAPIQAAFPDHPVHSAIAYIGAHRTAPGRVEHVGRAKLVIGRYGDLPPGPALRELAAAFARGGRVEVETTDRIAFYRWQKLLWNGAFNPVSVVGGRLYTREMTDRGERERLCRSMMEEIAAVANAAGVPIRPEQLDETMEYTRDFPPYKTSMLVDFEAGRSLEIDAILGNAVAEGRRRGVPVPHLESVLTLLRAVVRDRQ